MADELTRASIVVPVHGQWRYTRRCLDSVRALLDVTPYELIVVDDCSPDDTAARLAERSDVRVVRTPRNLGYLGACNLGAQSATGDVLIILNNDTVVHGGWLDALVRTVDDDPIVGQVASLVLDPDGTVMDAGGIVFADGSAHNYGRRFDAGSSEVQTVRDVDYCTGTSFAIRSQLFSDLGRFDTRYLPAYYEDVDLSFKVRAAGLRTIVQPRSVVTHVEGATHGADGQGGLKRFQAVNRITFRTKWQSELAENGRPGSPTDIWRGRQRSARGMFLICDPDVPTPDRDAGSRRISAIIEQLQDMGFAVYLAAANSRGLQPYTRDLEQRGVSILITHEQQTRFIAEAGSQLAAVMLCRPHVANRYLSDVFRHAIDSVLIYDTVDLAALRMKRQAVLENDRRLARLADHEWSLERTAIDLADVTLVVSEVEKRLLADVLPGARVEVLSTVHDPVAGPPQIDGRSGMVFVANYQHPPNIDAVHWFVDSILPLVRAEVPDATVRLVGASMTPEIAALRAAGIDIVGWVHDLTPIYRSARVVIAPLRFGAGVKGKVAEAIEFGVPLVGTSVAIEGMDLIPGTTVAVGDDEQDFADAVVSLLTDDDRWHQLAGAGQDVLREKFSSAAARQVLDRILPADPPPRTIVITTDLARH